MHPKVIFTAVLLSLLVFGCLGPSVPSGGSDQPGQQGAGGQQPAGGNESSGGQPSGGNGPSGGQPNGGGNPPAGGNNLAGMAYGELIALGVPMQCDITTTSGENQVTVRLYKGPGSDMRVESPAAGGPCAKMISLMKGDKYYVGCEQGELMPGCQWLVFSQTAPSATTGGYEEPDYSDVPESQISCIPWVLDTSKFEAPANACNLDDFMKNIPID